MGGDNEGAVYVGGECGPVIPVSYFGMSELWMAELDTYWKAGMERQTDRARFSYPTRVEPTFLVSIWGLALNET